MMYFAYKESEEYEAALLVPQIQLSKIESEYLSHMAMPKEKVILYEIFIDPSRKKTKATDIKDYLKDLKDYLADKHIKYLLITDAEYFKVMTKKGKADPYIGYVLDYEGIKLIYVPSYKAVFYDPVKTREKIKIALDTFNDVVSGDYKEPGKEIIKSAKYPATIEEISKCLEEYKKVPCLTCDIETYSLKPHKAGLGTIAFAINKHEGIAFKVDFSVIFRNDPVRKLLRTFFEEYQGKLIFHNIGFDATVLIYQLWMEDITDTEGLLKGLDVMLRNFDDTKLIAYLCTNSCSGNDLGLKSLAQEYAGNYAQDEIENIANIECNQLLEYNLVDCLATWYVFDKFNSQLDADNQRHIYETLFKPAMKDIIQMQLTGLPLNMKRVLEVKEILEKDYALAYQTLVNTSIVKVFVGLMNEKWVERKNSEYKVKRVTLDDAHEEFNPRSGLQLRELLYDYLKLPVLGKTDSNLPSTEGKILEALKNHTKDENVLAVLNALLDLSAVDKILTAFIPAFENAVPSKDGWHYLIGNFNLGGTVSGRLSSNRPNLQNLPATGSKYAKLIKSCFQAPPGWFLCGLDFNALEDHISALTTKDRNKLKVYTEGYDGHCLRAYSYWPELMPDITEKIAEICKEGRVFKITHDDGSIEYLNEFNPKFKEIANGSGYVC